MKRNFLYQITAASRQNGDLGVTAPRSPFCLSSVLSWICWTPPEQNSWVRHFAQVPYTLCIVITANRAIVLTDSEN